MTPDKKVFDNILETIGNTPLIKLHKTVADLPCAVYAKVEFFNPGNSIKDRMALKMLEVAEQEGKIKPGGTIIEGTSGNTGMGLALAAIQKGYRCIFTTTDKQSKEKVDILKAFGAEVIVCPTNVEPEDPKSYYSVSKRLATEVPNSWYVNQYDNRPTALRITSKQARNMGTDRRKGYTSGSGYRYRRYRNRHRQIPEREKSGYTGLGY